MRVFGHAVTLGLKQHDDAIHHREGRGQAQGHRRRVPRVLLAVPGHGWRVHPHHRQG